MFGKPEVPAATRPEVPLIDSFPDRIRKAANLKDYAVTNGIDVDPEIIAELNKLFWALSADRDSLGKASPEDRNRLDAAVLKLTQLTYPATIDNIPAGQKEGSSSYARFKARLIGMSIAALVVGVIGLLISAHDVSQSAGASSNLLSAILSSVYDNPALGNSLLAVSLGFLGSAVYSLFNVLKVIPSKAFSPNDEFENYARLVLGVLMGWVFYFALAQTAFADLAHLNDKGATDGSRLLILLPFIAGYSTTLVVGLLNKIIRATEITIDLEDHREIGFRAGGKKK